MDEYLNEYSAGSSSSDKEKELFPSAVVKILENSSERYSTSDMHAKAIRLQEESITNTFGKKVRKNWMPTGPSKIGDGLTKMGVMTHQQLLYFKGLFEVSYSIAKQSHSYVEFREIIELEKLHTFFPQ